MLLTGRILSLAAKGFAKGFKAGRFFAHDMTSVLVGVVTYDGHNYCRELFFQFLASLTYPELEFFIVTNSGERDAQDLKKHTKKLIDAGRKVTVVVDNVGGEAIDKIVSGRNKIRERLLASKHEWLLFLDSDGVGPRNAVETLLSHDEKLVTGYCLSWVVDAGKKDVRPVLWRSVGKNKFQQLHIAHVLKPRLLPVDRAGLACSLIHRSVLADISFSSPHTVRHGEDSLFYEACAQRGLQLYCDTRVRFWHIKYPPGDERNQALNPLNYKLVVKRKE